MIEFKPKHWTEIKPVDPKDLWVVPEIISKNTTLLYGEAKSGKSTLAANLVASLVTGEEFLGRRPDRTYRVAVCWTDDSGETEYQKLIRHHVPAQCIPDVFFQELPVMQTHAHWEALFAALTAEGVDFVVIDSHSQAANGDVNQQQPNKEFFNGVRLFTRAGIPVVVVSHSTDKSGENGIKSDKPMGHSYIRQAVRWQCFVKRDDFDGLRLTFSGNHARKHAIELEQIGEAEFKITKVISADELLNEKRERKRKRDRKKLDQNREIAAYLRTLVPDQGS